MLLAISADIAERFRWPTATQEEGEDIILSGLDVLFDYMKDQTFMKGIANIADLVSKKGGQERANGVSRVIQDLTGSQIPFSSLLANIERVMDPTMHKIIPDRDEPPGLRDFYAGLRRLDERTPFGDQKSPQLRDRFGNPRFSKGAKVYEALLPPFIADIIGNDAKKIKSDPVLMAVVAAGVPLKMPSRKIDGIPLNEQEYDQLVQWSAAPPGEDRKGNSIPTFYEVLKDLVSSKTFKALAVSDQQVLIKGIDAQYKSIAKDYLLFDPQYEEQFQGLRQKVREHEEIIQNVGRQLQ